MRPPRPYLPIPLKVGIKDGRTGRTRRPALTAIESTTEDPAEALADNLDAFLDAPFEADQAETERRGEMWVCDTADKADWLLRRMGGAQRRQEAARAMAAERIEQVQAWLDAELRRHQHRIDWAAGELEGYTRRALAADPLRKTIHLPAGELRARKLPDTWEVDATSVVEWATAAGRDDLVIVKQSPDRAAMKRELVVRDGSAIDPTTGERVPGVTVLPGGVRYSAHPA